ncbi:MAG TPA: prepilin-type N-terminal cleavage/methylation domain-containing protein [Acidimicrobiales bacterium]|nr:prepilin-type N-terminal cleavage/methylation domain-containing protein [Acidimicrobiales bacterium]
MRRDESGFTLIELLISAGILALVIGPLTAAITVGLRNTDQITSRLALSHDSQTASAYFYTDVQSADSVSTTDTTDCPVTTQTLILALGSSPRSSNPASETEATVYVCYEVNPAASAGDETQLTRQVWQSGSLISSAVVAHNLDASQPQPASVTCSLSACDGQPETVTLAVQEVQITHGTPQVYSFTLQASRRTTP